MNRQQRAESEDRTDDQTLRARDRDQEGDHTSQRQSAIATRVLLCLSCLGTEE